LRYFVYWHRFAPTEENGVPHNEFHTFTYRATRVTLVCVGNPLRGRMVFVPRVRW
jgi:hypothetical protein